jgi:hypothetical protein
MSDEIKLGEYQSRNGLQIKCHKCGVVYNTKDLFLHECKNGRDEVKMTAKNHDEFCKSKHMITTGNCHMATMCEECKEIWEAAIASLQIFPIVPKIPIVPNIEDVPKTINPEYKKFDIMCGR